MFGINQMIKQMNKVLMPFVLARYLKGGPFSVNFRIGLKDSLHPNCKKPLTAYRDLSYAKVILVHVPL